MTEKITMRTGRIFTDANNERGSGIQDEPLNDDLGKDGVGVFDPQYLGPDEGEGDGLPTLGEPAFRQHGQGRIGPDRSSVSIHQHL
jgi:hypothetical protein